MRSDITRRLTALLAFAVLAACGSTGTPAGGTAAELVLHNGKVVTMDADLPEAQAVAISGDRIIAVGTSEEIREYIGDATRVIDLGGRLVVPGFIEGHGHYMGSAGRRRSSI